MAHPRAGQPAEPADLVDVPRLVTAYYAEHPDPADPAQQVSFGTSGHRGSSLRNAFNSDHILAVSEALEKFARVDPQRAELVKLRYFVGLTFEQAAEWRTKLTVILAAGPTGKPPWPRFSTNDWATVDR